MSRDDKNTAGAGRTCVRLKNSHITYRSAKALEGMRQKLTACGKVLLLTDLQASPAGAETVTELARSLCKGEKKVLFLDANLRQPVTEERFEDAAGLRGLGEMLRGVAGLDECLFGTQYPDLYVILSGISAVAPGELLSGDRFRSLIDVAREVFDYIVIDCPATGGAEDAAAAAALCDAAIPLLCAGAVRASAAKGRVKQLGASGCRIPGVILYGVKQ